MKNRTSKFWKENKSVLLFVFLMFAFRSSFADWNVVPTGSMKPTILEGDRILVNKMAYDIRFPFTHVSLLKIADPKRGDIVIFDSKATDKRMVKRVIGLPGDLIELKDNRLSINAERVRYRRVSSAYRSEDRSENLLGLEYQIRVQVNASPLSSYGPITIPAGHYLVLGDNRDNSADSRMIGLVPRREIVGRSRSVVMSLDKGRYYAPRFDRFFYAL